MSAQLVLNPQGVVERSRLKSFHGHSHGCSVVCQKKNRPTDVPLIQNFAGTVKTVIYENGRPARYVVVVPPGLADNAANIMTFEVVDELPEHWKFRITRKRS